MATHGKLRLGFIGAGWWATANHMPILRQRDDVEFAAVCRLGARELQLVKDRFGFEYATESAAELVDYPGLDAVIVTSPHTLHFEHAKLALERGLHVMCEKPLCTKAAHARELVRLARAKGLHLLVPYGWHYKDFTQQAKRWMEESQVGRIEYVLCHMASPIRGLLQGRGFAAQGTSGQAGGLLFDPDPRTWADPIVAGGGYGHAQISHSTGLLFWLTGLAPASVHALMTAPESQVDLYDAITVRFTNGAIGTVSGAGTIPPSNQPRFQLDLRIFGTEGILLLDMERARLELRRYDGRMESPPLDANAGAYECAGPPHNFVDLVLGKTTVNSAPGDAAMQSVVLLDAAYTSAQTGQTTAIAAD